MGAFTVYPAIDLRQGRVVRLWRGNPDQATEYSPDPLSVAEAWMQAGAQWLHVINLDGAFGEDQAKNLQVVQRILQQGARIQFGGGVRSMQDLQQLMDKGLSRVILGTAALRVPTLVQQAIAKYGAQRIVVSIDTKQDEVQVEGWLQGSGVDPLSFAHDLRRQGLRIVILTDIQRDGTQHGVDLSLALQVQQEVGLEVIVAGGVSALQDVHQVRAAGLGGVVIGRALYEGQLDLKEALAC